MKKIQVLIVAAICLFNISCKNENACCSDKKSKIMISDSGLSCKLTDEKLLKRKAFLKEKIFNHVEKTNELENGFVFHFPEKEGVEAELMEFIAAERECCPFFEIKLHFQSYKKGINLKISGEEGVKEFLKAELLD